MLLANGCIWDLLRMMGRGTVLVQFHGRLFLMRGNPFWPWPDDPYPELIPMDDRGLPMRRAEFWIMPMDATPGLRPGAIYRWAVNSGDPAARVGNVSDLKLYGRWS